MKLIEVKNLKVNAVIIDDKDGSQYMVVSIKETLFLGYRIELTPIWRGKHKKIYRFGNEKLILK